MSLRMLVVPAVLLAFALPAQARAGDLTGIVVAKQPQRGTFLLVRAHGLGVTVRGNVARTAVGERVAVRGARLHDGTVRSSRVRILGHVRTATVRGTVLRKLTRGTLLASGRSVVLIHASKRRLASAADHGGLKPGDVGEFTVGFEDDGMVEAAPPSQLGQAQTARIEGEVVSVSPFVVSADGLPLTITVPDGTTLPAGLAAGQRIELTVQIGAGNVFTLVAIDENESESEGESGSANPGAQAQEIEVKGLVTSSTSSQIDVNVNGTTVTFVAPSGTTLPVLPAGTSVEVRGVRQNGTNTVTRLRVEGGDGGDGH